jgi:hypothetical protein
LLSRPTRYRRSPAAAALAIAALAPAAARAQNARLQAVLEGTVGVTDNVLSASEEAPVGPEAGAFGSVSPGLVFRYDTPRTAQTLSYTFTPSFYFGHPEASSYTNTAAWSGRFVTTPTTELTLGANGTQGQLNTYLSADDPGRTALRALPSGGTVFVQGGVNEGFSKQLSPVVTAAQSASFLAYTPLGEDAPARTYGATGALSAQRLWRHDTGALALTFAYTHFDNVPVGPSGSEALEARDQLVNTLVASWQHDYGHHVSSQLDLGVTQATDLGGDYAQIWQPAGLLALRYVRDEAQAELAYAHAAQLNVFLSQIDLVDQATLRVAAPLVHAARLGAEGSAGAQLSRPIVDGELGDPATVLLFDAALLWSPVASVPDLELALRYQHLHQIATTTVGTDEADTRIIRNTVTLTVGFAFPETTETSTRILMTQPFGSAPAERRKGREEPVEELP